MAKTITAKALLSKHVRRRDRILLVNPPVEETRYSWLRWNQPLDLLKIGSFLRSQVGCQVDLLDYMKPDAAGHVRENWLPRDRRYCTVKGERFPMRRYGRPYTYLKEWLEAMRAAGGQAPTQVWITSLCSYWYESIAELCRLVHLSLPDAQIVLLGQYPRLMPAHAANACAAHLLVTQPFSLEKNPAALDLYTEEPPPFAALQLDVDSAVADARAAVDRGINHVAFFTDDLCRDDGGPLQEIVEKTHQFHKHLRYHLICGLNPARVTPEIARVLARRQIAELHFEEADAGEALDVEAYRKARSYLREAGMKVPDNRQSGFVWIGRPGDQLEQLILRSFQVLDCLGGLILKPFTPTPGGPEHVRHEKYLSASPHRDWSPHFFPFAELNRITRGEYHDLYRVAAFLNEKIRSGSFDFLNGTLGAQMLRESLRKEVWKIEPSPLRLAD